MKRIALLFLIILTFGFSLIPASAQNTLTVANGTVENELIPIDGQWMDVAQHNQIIYPEDMLSSLQGQVITRMEFYLNKTFSFTSPITVSLGSTTASQFTTNSLDNTTALTQVYAGPVVILENRLVINFTEPYTYTGGNLLFDLTVADEHGNYTITKFYGINRQNASIYKRDMPSFPPTLQDFLPKTTFSANAPTTCTSPTYLNIFNITTTSATVSWWCDNSVSSFRVQYMPATQDNWDLATNVTTDNLTINLTNLLPGTSYNVRVQSVCNDGSYATSLQTQTFSTKHLPVPLPYIQDFETSPTPISDFDILGSGMNQWIVGSSTFKPASATAIGESGHCLYISDNGSNYNYNTSSTSNAYAVLEVVFDDTPMEYHFSFDYKTNGESTSSTIYDFFSVYIVDANIQIQPGVDIPAVPLIGEQWDVNNWTHLDFTLNNVVGTSKKIIFYWENDGSMGTPPPAAVDNIMISGSTCGQPNMLSATGITTEGATLNWNQTGDATSWIVYYKASSDTGYTQLPVNGDPTCTISGLSADTYYTFFVVADCDGLLSAPSAYYSFRTLCGALTSLPYSADFDEFITENGSLYYPCWTRLASNPAHIVYVYDMPDYSYGNSAGCLDFSHTPNCYTIAVMPAFANNIPVNTLMLDFYLDKTGNAGTFEVGVMTDPTNASTFQVVETVNSNITGNGPYAYEHHVVTLNGYQGSGQYIAFRVANATDCGYRMDNLIVSAIPSCMAPINFHAIEVTDDAAMLTWTETSSIHNWTIKYGPTGFNPETQGTSVSALYYPFTITDLESTSTYDFYVQTNCGEDQSEWVGPVTVKTGVYYMGVTGSDTLVTCGKYIYDDGGPDNDHSEACDYTLVIYPATEGSGLTITGNVSISDDDFFISTLTFYAGVGTNGSVLGSYSGVQEVNIAYGGPVTVRFTSDEYGFIIAPGFELLVQCTDCFPPTNVTASSLTDSTATVTWDGNASNYAIYLSGAASGYYTTSANTFTFTNLSNSSPYGVQIRSLCGTDSSLISLPTYFATICQAITVDDDNPWFEDFEDYPGVGAQPFVCWSTPITAINGGPYVFCGDSLSAYSGFNSAVFNGASNMLVLPEFTNNIHDLRLTFKATAYFPEYTTVDIGVITDVNDPSTFQYLFAAGTPGVYTNATHASDHYSIMGPYDFNTAPVLDGRIAIRFTRPETFVSTWNMDDFTVSLSPDCISPVKNSVTASNVDGHNALITFTDNDPSHHAWILFYKAENDPSWTSVPTNTTSVSLTNLTPMTEYTVMVITNCGTIEDNPDATNPYTFSTTVACPAPSEISAVVSTTSAIISWFGNADSYAVTCGDIDTVVTGSSVNLTGLLPATEYSVSIIANCGQEGTSEAGAFTFTTACDVVSTFPYTEGFEDITLGCWSQEILFGDNPWTLKHYNQHSGEQCISMSWTVNTASRLISPIFDLTNLSNPTLYFYQHRNGFGEDNHADTLAVYYRTSINGDWVRLEGYQSATNGYQLDSLALPNASATYQIAFVGYGNDGIDLYLDDIMVNGGSGTAPGSCTKPTNLFVSDITSTSAYVTWTAGGNETEWSIRYRKYNSDWLPAIHTTNPYYNLTNLQPSTPYHVEVRALCSETDASDWTNMYSFHTEASGQPTDPTVVTFAASTLTSHSAKLSGAYNNPGQVTIIAKGFAWREASSNTYTYENVESTSSSFTYTLTNLNPATDYTYKAFVIFNNDTAYGNTVTFSTLEDVEPCAAPSNLHTTVVEDQLISIAWDANAAVSNWGIRYRVANGQWNNASSTNNSYTITGLIPNTLYEIQVQAECDNDLLSEWSAITVTTSGVGITNHLENSITLFPNPAKEYINVECRMMNEEYTVTDIQLYDVYGKAVRTVEGTNNNSPLRINVSGLADGMYFVRVTTDAGTVTKTFVKK